MYLFSTNIFYLKHFFKPCVLFHTCFFLFKSLFPTHVLYSKHVSFYLEHFLQPMFFIPNISFSFESLFSTHGFYSRHVSFYLNHFFPPMCFIPDMFFLISIKNFHPCLLFQPCLVFGTREKSLMWSNRLSCLKQVPGGVGSPDS